MANIIHARKCELCGKEQRQITCQCGNVTTVFRTCHKCGRMIWGANLRKASKTGTVRCLTCDDLYHRERYFKIKEGK